MYTSLKVFSANSHLAKQNLCIFNLVQVFYSKGLFFIRRLFSNGGRYNGTFLQFWARMLSIAHVGLSMRNTVKKDCLRVFHWSIVNDTELEWLVNIWSLYRRKECYCIQINSVTGNKIAFLIYIYFISTYMCLYK